MATGGVVMAPDDTSAASVLDVYPRTVHAYADMVRALGEAQLSAAQADYQEALANREQARANAAWTLATQLQTDLDLVNATVRQSHDSIVALEKRSHAASMILYGAPIAAYHYAEGACRGFLKEAILAAGPDLFSPTIPAGSIDGAQFVDNLVPTCSCDAPPREVTNALQLLDWSMRREYIARTGTQAQLHFVAIIQAIASVAQRTLDAIDARRTGVRAEIYADWRPAEILGAQSEAAEKRILGGGGSTT